MGMRMRAKVIFVLVAAVSVAGYAASEALARGGGGGHGGHGGMMSGWHGFSMRGMHHINMHRMNMSSHGAHFPFKGQRAYGLHNLGHNQHHDGHRMMAQGQWHRVPGFGSPGQKGFNMPGVWHKVASFGGHGQFKRDVRRDWQAGGGGWGYVGVGDLCLNPGSCQGVWQVAPQGDAQPRSSPSLQRDWQVDGEL